MTFELSLSQNKNAIYLGIDARVESDNSHYILKFKT